MPRMTNFQENNRCDIEEVMFACSNARTLLSAQINLRVRQAIRRDSRLQTLLGPALDYLDQVDLALDAALTILSDEWQHRQNKGW